LRQAIAAPDPDVGVTDVQHLDHHLVVRARIVRIDDADAVGHHQPPLERGAASGENPEEMTGRDLDDEAGPDQGDVARRDDQIVRRSQVETR
jgi:hypothetical protein